MSSKPKAIPDQPANWKHTLGMRWQELRTSETHSEQRYTVPQAQELPLAMSVPDAARLCGLEVGAGFWLAHHDWQPFIKHYGTKGRMLVRTSGLLAWLECDGVPAATEAGENGREVINGHS